MNKMDTQFFNMWRQSYISNINCRNIRTKFLGYACERTGPCTQIGYPPA